MPIIKINSLKVLFLSLSFLILSVPCLGQEQSVRSRVTAPIDASVRVTLSGNTHPLATAKNDAGPAPDSLPMQRMLLVLRRGQGQEAALQNLIHEQGTKGSPFYHKWLTPQEFGAQFGPSDEDIRKITGWLSGQGFQVNRPSLGRGILEFSGTAGQVKNAFHTEIHKYIVGRTEHWANNADPQIPLALAQVVQGIVSLHNFPTASQKRQAELFTSFAQGGSRPIKPEFTYAESGCATDGNCYGVAPADFATIYDIASLWASGIDGTGQTIAIASGSNIRPTDVHNFRQLFNLPSNDPVIFVDGTDPGIVQIEELFTNFSVQWTGAIAKSATIELVVAQTTSASRGTDLAAIYVVDNNLAPVLTESLIDCEDNLGAAGNVFYAALWEQAAAEGITVVIPTGDTGSAACDSFYTETAATHGLGVNGVASTPFNVAVGGTDFDQSGQWSQYWNTSNDPTTHASAKSYIPERSYNDTCTENGPNGCPTVNSAGSDLMAGGGGLSKYNQQPAWQQVSPFQLVGSRGIPDVSMFAGDGNDGSFYIICEEDAQASGPGCNLDPPYTSFANIGGTTGAASAFAGIMALVNQKTGGRQGNANVVLYQLAAMPATAIFHDVTLGSNSVACVAGSPNCSNTSNSGYGYIGNAQTAFYPAYPGYDLSTGWGSVDANVLVTQWSSFTLAGTTTTLTNLAPTTLTHGQPVTFSITVNPQSGSSTPTGDVALMVHPSAGVSYAVDFITLQNGSASGSTNALPGGSYQVTAHYAGDGIFGPSDSAAVSVTVTPQASQTILSVPENILGNLSCETQNLEFPYGTYIILGNVNISGAPCEGVNVTNYPTGSIQLTADGNPLDAGTYALNSRAHFEDHSASLSPGNHTLVGSYSGDSSYSPSTSAPLSILIDPANTTLSLTANLTTVVAGTSVTLTAVVNTTSVGAPPSGTVTFTTSSGTILGTINVQPSAGNNYVQGIATLKFSPTNSVNVNANYSGDLNYGASIAPGIAITSGTPDFALASTPNPLVIVAGATGAATITVTSQLGYTGNITLACPAALPAGTNCAVNPSSVTLPSNVNSTTTTITIQTTAPSNIPGLSSQLLPSTRFSPYLSAGIALASFLFMFAAPRRVRGLLGVIFAAGMLCFAVGCAQVVNSNNSSKNSNLTLTTSSVKAAQGTPFTLSAAVSADHNVSGTVDFLDSGVALATGVPVSGGRAVLTVNNLSVGTHSLTATYSGDSSTNHAATASPLFQVVTGDVNLKISASSGSLNHAINIDLTLK